MRAFEVAGLSLIEVDANGPMLATEQDALDLLGEIYGHEADMIVVPVSRLPDDFFRLATGIAGAMLQKFTNYGQRVAFVGDISVHTAKSKPLRDFLRETNKRKQIVFAADEAELEAVLSR
jgi:hypothetical protein